MDHATHAWLESLDHVINTGVKRFPRSLETKEALNAACFFDMNYPICHHDYRGLNYSFLAAEAYWITSGSPLVEDIEPYMSHIKQYSDDGYIFNGAYGPAFLSQINFVVETLLADPSSRQAVMTIWHPNPITTKDHKCTVALNWYIRDRRLCCTVFMRSNDLYLGRPYDMFNFSIMSLRILTSMNARFTGPAFELGDQCLHAVSSHIYAKDYANVSQLARQPQFTAKTSVVPVEATKSWQYVVDSLLACRDMSSTKGLWKIRP